MARKIVIPGEVIVESDEFLPGEGTEKIENKIIARKFGLSEDGNGLIKVIPLSGTYQPRRGNVVIGTVENVTFNGWVIDIDTPEFSFLPLSEVPKYVNKNGLDEVMTIGDTVIAKIWNINSRGIDLSIKGRGLGKIGEGIVVRINPNKVPRIIGKEGSMINMIKDACGCNITVGQNGWIWIKGDNVEQELFAKKAILFVVENSFIEGLTDKMEKFLEENKNE